METKKVIKFSFLPTKVDNKWIWLKKYVATYEYKYTSWNEYQTYGFLLQNQIEKTCYGYKWILTEKHLL
jgi:hypothetical protein